MTANANPPAPPALPAAGAAPPAAPPAVPPGEPPKGNEPFAIFPDAASFNARLDRETKKALAKLGIEDPDEVKKRLGALDTYEKKAEEERRAQLSKEQQLQADLQAKTASETAAISAKEEAQLKAHLYEVFAEKGVRNFGYAFYEVSTKLASLGDGETLDERAFLDELAKDPQKAIALGLTAPASPAGAAPAKPATTSPGAPPGAAPPPLAGGAPATGAKTAYDLTPAEWAAKKQSMGIF